MKSILLSFSCLFMTQIVIAQYIPFPENAKWSMSIDIYDDPYADPYVDSRAGYVHEINGDTIIDGVSYQKLFERLTWWKKTTYYLLPNGDTDFVLNQAGNYTSNSSTLIGLIRQDTAARKVYFTSLADALCTDPNGFTFSDEEMLLFDFDIVVGDVVSLGQEPESFFIESIDSVQYNDGIYRKRYFVSVSYPEFHFIEGIGASTGLFAGVRGAFVEGEWCNLTCFSDDGSYIIGDGFYGCDSIDVLSPVLEIDKNTKVDISPNPFNDYLMINFQSLKSSDFRLVIHNNLGQLMTEKQVSSGNQYEINTQHFPTGIFIISIYDGMKLIGTEKLIK